MAAVDQRLDIFLAGGAMSHLDVHFARLMERLGGSHSLSVLLAAGLVSRATGDGHICLDLKRLAIPDRAFPCTGDLRGALDDLVRHPEQLLETPVVGRPGERRPMILDEQERLYLYRYWAYENGLVRWVQGRAVSDLGQKEPAEVRALLSGLFPGKPAQPDWQQVAALVALRKPFCIISGGPGTGKTTTVARILAMLLATGPPEGLRIRLAAPTGKAAARLQEAVMKVRPSLEAVPGAAEGIPHDVHTVHRLLGAVSHSPYFRHHAENPLPADVVVVDEASMLDLALFYKLTQAMPEQSRLILLGDKDQLASVEAGAVLGDLCDSGRGGTFSEPFAAFLKGVLGEGLDLQKGGRPLNDAVVELRRNYRFSGQSGLGMLSEAIKGGDAQGALAAFAASPSLIWRPGAAPEALARMLREPVLEGYERYLSDLSPDGLFERFDGFRILSPLREGPYGVHHLNQIVRFILVEEGLVAPGGVWYTGRPVLVTRNDYRLRLFNGDVGITLPDASAEGGLRVFFPGPQGEPRGFHPMRLPPHETVFAMTVHKAQGSEFDKVVLVLPDRDNPLMTRELVYTAVTRARHEVVVLGDEGLFEIAVGRRIERSSGLRDALWSKRF